MLVKDVMRKTVICCSPETTLRDAATAMTDNSVGCLIVKRNEKVVGIVTDHNILCAFAEYGSIEKMPVSEIMTKYVIYTSPGTRLEKAVSVMTENKIKKLPVIFNEKLVGIITSSDIMAAKSSFVGDFKKLKKK